MFLFFNNGIINGWLDMLQENVIEWNGYALRRVTESDVDLLVEISESAFGIRPSREYYINKNLTSSFGEPYLGYIALDIQNKPAAFYGVYACELVLDGKKIKAVQSGDTMTHKSHTGKGLFTKLDELTYELCKRNGIYFVFGFPNYNSYPGFVKKLGWVCPGKLNEYRIKVFTIPLVKLSKKVKPFNLLFSIWKRLVNSFYKTNDWVFENSVLELGVGGVHRDQNFVSYKVENGGSYFIMIDGVRLWLKTDGFLFIGDIEMDKIVSFEVFVKKLKRYAFLVGADIVLFQTVPATKLDKAFSSIMNPSEAFPYGFCSFNDLVDPSIFKYNMCDLDTF